MNRKQIYLPSQQIDRIKRAAGKNGLNFSEMLRRIIDWFFEKKTGGEE